MGAVVLFVHLSYTSLQRLRQWLNNYTHRLSDSDLEELSDDSKPESKPLTTAKKNGRGKKKSKIPPEHVLTLGAKRPLQAWQVFWGKHQDTLQPLIDADWVTHHNGDDVKKTKENGWISFLHQWASKKYAELDGDAKSRIEAARKISNGFEVMHETIQQRNERFER